jgi:tripartite-type tricarboxylate transporter receptor subunit TctC
MMNAMQCRCAFAAIAVILPFAAIAQPVAAYPVKPIRLVVVNPPGSGVDIVARMIAKPLSEALRQQLIVDNRPGASGIVAADLVSKSLPDGYTLLMGSSSSQAVNASIYTNLPYDPIKDLAPISLLASTPYLLVAHPSLAAKTVKELIAMAKEKPGQLNYATGGLAVASTLAGELFKSIAGVNIVMVPYKGTPQATSDVVAGQVQLAFSTMPAGLPLVRAGKLRALGVTSAKRLTATPDIPTISESGLPGYEVQTWFGLLAPRAIPADILNRLHREAVTAVQHADIRDKLIPQGYEVTGTTPAQFGTLIVSEIAKWTKVVNAAGIPKLSVGEQ